MGSKETVLITQLGVELGFRSSLFENLEKEGHDVFIVGPSVGEVRRLINRDLGLTVALIDIDISGKNTEEEIAALIRKRCPWVKIISVSQEPQEWADKNLGPLPNFRDIEKVIREL